MVERIEKLIGMLDAERDKTLNLYLEALENYDGHRAADTAGALHDIDRHITNLHMELKRIGLAEQMPKLGKELFNGE